MLCPDEREFLQEQLEAAKARLVQLDAAISAVLGGAQMYSLDSGQTRQMVTRASLGQLRELRSQTVQDIQRWMRELCLPCGPTVISPGF